MSSAGHATTIVSAALVLMCEATGCYTTIHYGNLTALSSSSIPARFEVMEERVAGKDCMKTVLFVPVGKQDISIDEAVRDSVSKAPDADALTHARAYTSLLPLFLYNEMCHRVKGTAVNTSRSRVNQLEDE